MDGQVLDGRHDIGGNNPPEEDKLEPLRERARDIQAAVKEWQAEGAPDDDESLNALSGVKRQIDAFDKDAKAAEKEAVKPLKDAQAEIAAKFLPVKTFKDRMSDIIQPLLVEGFIRQQERIDAAAAEARREAEEAAQKAEMIADRAADSGSFEDHEQVTIAAAEAEAAARSAKAATAAKPKAGGNYTVDGRKKSVSVRTREVPEIFNTTMFLKWLALKKQEQWHGMMHEQGEKLVRAYLKEHKGAEIPGVRMRTEKKAV